MKKFIRAGSFFLFAFMLIMILSVQAFAMSSSPSVLGNRPGRLIYLPGEESDAGIKLSGKSGYLNVGDEVWDGDVIDYSEVSDTGMLVYQGPSGSGIANVSILGNGTITVSTPKSYGCKVLYWKVHSINNITGIVVLVPDEIESGFTIGGRDLFDGSVATAFESLSFGNAPGTILFFEDAEALQPIKKLEGKNSYSVGFGDIQEGKVLAWSVRRIDVFHRIVELYPYGLGGASYVLLDKGHNATYIDNLKVGMCIESGALIEFSSNHPELIFNLPKGLVTSRFQEKNVTVLYPSDEYEAVRYWIIQRMSSSLDNGYLLLTPLYDTKPCFEFFYGSDEGLKNNPWQAGDNVKAYIENETMYFEGSGDMWTHDYSMPAWRYTTYVVKKVVFGEGITSLGSYACENFKDLEEVSLPSTLTSIGKCSFRGCTKLNNVEIKDKVTYIGYGAFQSCYGLKKISIGLGLAHVESTAFAYTDLDEVYYASNQKAWESINIDNGYGLNDGLLSANIFYGDKMPNTGSVFSNPDGNTVFRIVVMVSAVIVAICAVICSIAYLKKSGNKQQ